jgi:tRNA (mo5U34)-methyltransferase
VDSHPAAIDTGARDDADAARRAIAANRLWYHTMELAPGAVTPGWFDLRPIVDTLPWPDVAGKRCLDVGPYDGFLSFELERRGAAEVIAADIGSASDWDWPLRLRQRGPATLAGMSGERTGAGFEIAQRLLGSRVERVEVSVYNLSPERLGSFDVVVCGSLLLHLRDPVRALAAIRGVCSGQLMSAEQVDPWLALTRRKNPSALQRGGVRCQWWIPNPAAHSRMVESAGFEIERTTKPYAIPFGPGHGYVGGRPGLRDRAAQAVTRALGGRRGLLHHALLATPSV